MKIAVFDVRMHFGKHDKFSFSIHKMGCNSHRQLFLVNFLRHINSRDWRTWEVHSNRGESYVWSLYYAVVTLAPGVHIWFHGLSYVWWLRYY